MADLLRMDYINSLPHPLSIRLYGDKHPWPLEYVCVETGLLKYDVVGKLQNGHIRDVAELIDASGQSHDPDDLYLEDDAHG